MQRRRMIALLVIAVMIAGGWYIYHEWKGTPIAALLQDPRQYEGRNVWIRGQVVDRTSLLVVKYFTVRDNTGEIKVISDGPLPRVGQVVRVRGRVRQAFAIGETDFVVFIEESRQTR